MPDDRRAVELADTLAAARGVLIDGTFDDAVTEALVILFDLAGPKRVLDCLALAWLRITIDALEARGVPTMELPKC